MATRGLHHHGVWGHEIEEAESVGSSSWFLGTMATELGRLAISEPDEIEEEEEEHAGTEEVDTVPVSRKVILADLLKSLGGRSAPTYAITQTDAGFHGYAKVDVFGIRGNRRIRELYYSHLTSFSTQNHAEEDAAQGLIELLKREFNFEVDDINWSVKNQYDHDRDDCIVEMEKLRKENCELKNTVYVLKDGWAATLRLLEPVHGMASNARSSAADAVNACYVLDPRGCMKHVLKRVAGVEEYIGKTLAEGSKDFNRAARMEEGMEK